jgi:hypothetical protein
MKKRGRGDSDGEESGGSDSEWLADEELSSQEEDGVVKSKRSGRRGTPRLPTRKAGRLLALRRGRRGGRPSCPGRYGGALPRRPLAGLSRASAHWPGGTLPYCLLELGAPTAACPAPSHSSMVPGTPFQAVKARGPARGPARVGRAHAAQIPPPSKDLTQSPYLARSAPAQGAWSLTEDLTIVLQHVAIGNKWSRIAKQLPGRTDNGGQSGDVGRPGPHKGGGARPPPPAARLPCHRPARPARARCWLPGLAGSSLASGA